MTLILIIGIAFGFIVVERLWPANALPKVRAWWPRVIFVNAIQIGIIIVAGFSWDRWLQAFSLFKLRDAWPNHEFLQAAVAYFIFPRPLSSIMRGWHRCACMNHAFFWRALAIELHPLASADRVGDVILQASGRDHAEFDSERGDCLSAAWMQCFGWRVLHAAYRAGGVLLSLEHPHSSLARPACTASGISSGSSQISSSYTEFCRPSSLGHVVRNL